jgi:hypothetical protein
MVRPESAPEGAKKPVVRKAKAEAKILTTDEILANAGVLGDAVFGG